MNNYWCGTPKNQRHLCVIYFVCLYAIRHKSSQIGKTDLSALAVYHITIIVQRLGTRLTLRDLNEKPVCEANSTLVFMESTLYCELRVPFELNLYMQ